MRIKLTNINKYNKSRLSSVLNGLIPSLLSIFSKRDNNLVILNSFHNEQFSDNTKYLFFYLIKNEKKIVKYVVNNDALRDKLIKEYGDYFIETKSKDGKKIALSAKLWITNSFEFPVNGFFLNVRRNVIQLTHGAPIKNSGLCENDVSFVKRLYYLMLRTNLSYVLSTSTVFNEYIAKHAGVKVKKVLTNSYPRYDPLFNGDYKRIDFNNNAKRVLYAPTWRHYAPIRFFPFESFRMEDLQDFLSKKNIIIYIRVHPRFEEKIDIDFSKYKNIQLFSGKNYPDINEYLNNFDALITDYSSIFYDFMILDKPIFYFAYDLSDYEKNVGFAVDYSKYAVGYHTNSFKEFCNDLEDAFSNDKYRIEREKISKICSGLSKTNSKDFIELLKEKNIF